MATRVKVLDWTPFHYENITVATGVVSMLTEAYRNNAGAIFLTIEDNNVSYRIDGGNPTSVLGHYLISSANQNLWLNNIFAIKNLRMIAIGGSSLIKVTYYRRQ